MHHGFAVPFLDCGEPLDLLFSFSSVLLRYLTSSGQRKSLRKRRISVESRLSCSYWSWAGNSSREPVLSRQAPGTCSSFQVFWWVTGRCGGCRGRCQCATPGTRQRIPWSSTISSELASALTSLSFTGPVTWMGSLTSRSRKVTCGPIQSWISLQNTFKTINIACSCPLQIVGLSSVAHQRRKSQFRLKNNGACIDTNCWLGIFDDGLCRRVVAMLVDGLLRNAPNWLVLMQRRPIATVVDFSFAGDYGRCGRRGSNRNGCWLRVAVSSLNIKWEYCCPDWMEWHNKNNFLNVEILLEFILEKCIS